MGVTSHPSHRSVLAQLTHTARQATDSQRTVTLALAATVTAVLSASHSAVTTGTVHAACDATATSATDAPPRTESDSGTPSCQSPHGKLVSGKLVSVHFSGFATFSPFDTDSFRLTPNHKRRSVVVFDAIRTDHERTTRCGRGSADFSH